MATPLNWLDLPWIELSETGSTNAEVLRRAAAGERRPLYIRAERQTAGRGRSGRSWQTLEGNLALSRLIPLSCPPAAVPQLALVAGVAVHDAAAWCLEGTDLAPRLRLKWPNDLLLDGAKVAGVLVEATAFGEDRLAVAGFGVNIAHAPVLPDRAAAALVDHAPRTPTPRAMGRMLAQRFEQALARWDDGRGFEAIRREWLDRALPIGTPMSINTGAGAHTGAFAGLDADGALLLADPAGRTSRFSFGDVTVISQ